jgi:tetratricopeptide (TPR) repeat protein
MRTAVYSIALNEAKHARRWAASAVDADVRIVLDTGSTDGTVEALEEAGVSVWIEAFTPWRFDVARNASLDLLPDDLDYCIALDMDEVLLPGWRNALDDAHRQHLTRPRYQYTWSWNPDGTPGLVYGGDKIHTRHGYRWRHPVHEVLTTHEGAEERQGWVPLEIHHHPDPTKSRSSYLPLLELAVAEDPDDDRNAFYYARELMFAGRRDEAIDQFRRHLSLPRAQWEPERAASMRHLARLDRAQAERWLLRAAAETPGRREGWAALAVLYYERNDWPSCLSAATRALSIAERPLEYLNEADAWGPTPHDMAALACYNLGLFREALVHGRNALQVAPDDQHLRTNLTFYERAAGDTVDDDDLCWT